MSKLEQSHITIDGVRTHVLTGGKADGPITVMLHGGTPGISPFCGGTHLWGDILDRLAESRKLIVPDLLGSGETGPGEGALTIDSMTAHVISLIKATAGGAPVHLVGHDLGGMVALWTAITAPEVLSSLTIVASNAASPTGDGVENLTFLSPPRPLWTAESQLWAFDRLSYSHHHIDGAMLDGAVAAAGREGHLGHARQDAPPSDSGLFVSIMRTKSRFFRIAREEGIRVPVQIIWAKNDPLVTMDHGLWLFRIIAAKQRAAQFHVINRSGSFPFREQPDEFQRVLLAFQDGLAMEMAA